MSTATTVPLKALRHSALNVRKANPEEDIPGLAANIQKRGLLQNLVVIPADEPDSYQVIAGARRLNALHHLLDQGELTLEHPVQVLIHDREDARSTSLSENVSRVVLNPADECEAYAAIVRDHADEPDPIAYCARRHGVSRAQVEQRLRLADLAPQILDALRDGRVGLDGAKAYGGFASHELQLAVFKAEEKRGYGAKHAPAAIRDAMKSRTYPANVAQARYVGIDAYAAAGGRSERELFMGADEGERLIDPTLLDKLAREKAMGELPALVKRDGFASGLLTPSLAPAPYTTWPKQPAGMERAYGLSRADMPKKQRAACIGVYTLDPRGPELTLAGFFKPAAARSASSGSVPETAEQRAANARAAAIALRAARLAAAPALAGTGLEERAIWPEPNSWMRPVEQAREGGGRLVAILIRVSDEEIEAMHADAEAELEAEAAHNDVVAAAEGETVDA